MLDTDRNLAIENGTELLGVTKIPLAGCFTFPALFHRTSAPVSGGRCTSSSPHPLQHVFGSQACAAEGEVRQSSQHCPPF